MRFVFVVLLFLAHPMCIAQPVKVYCFSGLGADERAFARLQLPAGYQPAYIQWVRPKRNESLANYALRIGHQVDSTRPFVFLGLSFGGVVAQQLAKSMLPQKIILISSLVSPEQVAGPMGLISRSGLYRILPFGLLTIPNKISYEAFGAKDPQTKAMLHDILQDTSPQFFRWATGAMTRWEPATPLVQGRSYYIHGSADRIIPPVGIHTLVTDGGHLMIYDKADQINAMIAERLR